MTDTEKIQLAEDWYNDPSTTQKEKALLEKLFPEIKPMYFLEIPAGDVAPAEEDGPLEEDIFPESSESEDEKIRIALISLVKEIKSQPLVRLEPWDKYIAYLEKQKEQKPAEWSEEDEEIIDGICDNLEYILRNNICAEQTKVNLKNRIKWLIRLKSLCPLPHRKPSEEQIDAMKYTLGNEGFYKLKAEIEKRLKNIRDYINGAGMKHKGPAFYKARGKESAYDALLSIITSLQQERPE